MYFEKDNQLWEEKFKLLEEYIESSKEIKEYMQKTGGIRRDTIIIKNGEEVKLGKWFDDQRHRFMKRYQGMTIKQIEENNNISNDDKYRLIKLLNLGVTYAIPREQVLNTWDNMFELLKKYINSSKEVKEYFENTGAININSEIKVRGKKIKLGRWLFAQKNNFMKRYQDKSIEEIENDEKIPQNDKERMLKLLNLGVSYSIKKELWEDNFDLLVKYINSSEEVKKYFEKNGTIGRDTAVNKKGKTIHIGAWLATQKHNLMRKYNGMSIEEIVNSDDISNEDKFKMKKLLSIGVTYPEIEELTGKQQWNRNYKLLKDYINSSEKVKEYVNKTGNIEPNTVIKYKNEDIMLGRWLYLQRKNFMSKYDGMTIDEIKVDKNILKEHKEKLIKLLNLGIYNTRLDRFNDWKNSFEILRELKMSSEEVNKEIKEKGYISGSVIIEKNGNATDISGWLNTQRQQLMRHYHGMTKEQIKEDINMPQEDKYKMLKLLNLGISYTKIREEEREWEKRYELLEEYLNSSEKIKERFIEKGRIPKKIVLEKDGEKIDLGIWFENQKYYFIRRNNGNDIKNIEDAENSEFLNENEKDRVKKFLKLGANLTTLELNNEEMWEEKFKLLNEYINSSKRTKKYFDKYGSIEQPAKIEKDGKIINIGTWVQAQKQMLMKKYHGMTIEQIEENDEISKIDKYRMKKLLNLGVTYPDSKTKIMNEKKWDFNYETLKEYINSSKERKEEFKQKGAIKADICVQKAGKVINIGSWLQSQRQFLMRKYQDKTLEEIENDGNISSEEKERLIKLLKLGVSYQKIRGQDIGKSTISASIDKCDDVQNMINSLKKKEREVQ